MSDPATLRRYVAHARSTDTFGRVLCSTRDQHFVVDGPVQNGCPGEAVTPGELFLSAAASRSRRPTCRSRSARRRSRPSRRLIADPTEQRLSAAGRATATGGRRVIPSLDDLATILVALRVHARR